MTAPTAASRSQHITTVAAIEKAALELIAEQGFEETPVEDIAAAAGISRRTFFRYFGSKNDIPFGDFGTILEALEAHLGAAPTDRPMLEVIADAVMEFNRVHTDGAVAHRERMTLIMRTPALRANAALHQGEWAAVIARYAAQRLDAPVGSLAPRLVGQIALGASNAAYEQWLHDEGADLADLMRRAFAAVGELALSELDG